MIWKILAFILFNYFIYFHIVFLHQCSFPLFQKWWYQETFMISIRLETHFTSLTGLHGAQPIFNRYYMFDGVQNF